MPDKNSTLTYRWMQEVWNKGRESAIDEMLETDAVVHGIDDIKERGPQGFKIFHRSFREQFPTVNIEVEEVVSENGFETGRCSVEATTAQGQRVHFTGMTFLHIRNGKIAEAWNSFDFMSMYRQLGFKLSSPQELIA